MRPRPQRTAWLCALLACAAALFAAAPAAAGTVTITRTFTAPGETPFVVPRNVSSVAVDAIGAAGTGQIGGAGAEVKGTLPVMPGQTLYVEVDIGGGAPNGGGFSSVALCSSESGCGTEFGGLPWYLAQPIVAAGGGGAGQNLGPIGSESIGGAGGLLGAAGGSGTSVPAGTTAGNGGGASLTGACLEGGKGVGGGTDGAKEPSTPFRGIGGSGGEGNFKGGGGGGGYLGGCGGGGSNIFNEAGGAGGGGASFANNPSLADYLSQLPTVADATSDLPGTSSTGSVTISFQDSNKPAPAVTVPSSDEQVGARPVFAGEVAHESDDDLNVTLNVEAADSRREPFTPIHERISAAADGSFVFLPPSGLPSGRYKASITQSLIGGGNENTGLAVAFEVDQTPPLIALGSPAPGSYLSAPPAAFTGTAGTKPKDYPGIIVRIYSGPASGQPVALVVGEADPDGAFSVPFDESLPDGSYTVVATQEDNGSGHGDAETSFVLDSVAPSISLTEPTPGEPVTDVPTFRGTAGSASGDLATVTVDLYGGKSPSGAPIQTLTTTAAPDGSFVVPAASALDPGTYTAVAVQLDQAGNEGQSEGVTFAVPSPAGPPSNPPSNPPSAPAPGDEQQPTSAPPLQAPSQRPTLVFRGKPIGVGGTVRLNLECVSTGPACEAAITGVARDKDARKKSKKVIVLFRRVSIAAGRQRRLTVPFDRRGRRILRRVGRLRVHLLAALAGGSRSRTVIVFARGRGGGG